MSTQLKQLIHQQDKTKKTDNSFYLKQEYPVQIPQLQIQQEHRQQLKNIVDNKKNSQSLSKIGKFSSFIEKSSVNINLPDKMESLYQVKSFNVSPDNQAQKRVDKYYTLQGDSPKKKSIDLVKFEQDDLTEIEENKINQSNSQPHSNKNLHCNDQLSEYEYVSVCKSNEQNYSEEEKKEQDQAHLQQGEQQNEQNNVQSNLQFPIEVIQNVRISQEAEFELNRDEKSIAQNFIQISVQNTFLILLLEIGLFFQIFVKIKSALFFFILVITLIIVRFGLQLYKVYNLDLYLVNAEEQQQQKKIIKQKYVIETLAFIITSLFLGFYLQTQKFVFIFFGILIPEMEILVQFVRCPSEPFKKSQYGLQFMLFLQILASSIKYAEESHTS